tara:strand:+ start:699 stop:1439 length:741 start_codon:yes stop_codon:yes gene_type:complete
MANTLQYDGSQPTEVVESLSAEEQDSLRVGEALQQEQQTLLAGKYKSAEELEQGYLELQKRMGEGQPNQQESSSVSDQLAKAYESYTSDKNFDATAFDNVSKEDLIKAFFENSEEVPQTEDSEGPDLSQSQVDEMMNSVGGKEQYQQIMNWAVQNLPKSDVEAFDAIVDSANPSSIAMAVEAMARRYTEANGQEGNMLQGRSAKVTDAYRSQAEMIRDMNDSRYDTDPAYRNDVMTKLANSPNLQF